MRRILSIFLYTLAACAVLAPARATFVGGSLGVSLSDPPPGASPPPGADRPHGALVADSMAGNPVIQSGDLIVAYNGTHVESSKALKRMVAETPAGREVELRVIRNGVPLLVRPTLQAASPTPTPEPQPGPSREPVDPEPRRLGAKVLPLDPDIARHIGWTPGEGLQVVEVLDDSPAGNSDLRQGDLVLEIEGISIRSPDHFLLVLNQRPRENVDLTVHRNGGRHTVFLRYDAGADAP